MENNFRKDVLEDLLAEKDNIHKQIELLESLKQTLHISAGTRIIKNSTYFLLQLTCWIFILALIIWLLFMFQISPFFELSDMLHFAHQNGSYREQDAVYAEWAIRFIVMGLVVLFFLIERQLRELKRKEKLNREAGKTLADVQAELEGRMNTLLAFEEKYNYLLQDDIKIEIDQFINPLNETKDLPEPPKGDRLLDE